MNSSAFRNSLLLLLCGAGVSAMGAVRPEGDKIEFSPPREELKVAPLTGTDLETRTFNFQRRDSGGSLSDVPSAVALPSPDQVNRMRALQELVEQRSAWARPDDLDDLSVDTDFQKAGAESDLTIDDLFERQTGGRDRGLQKQGENDAMSLERGRDREDGMDSKGRDRRGLNNRDPRDRGQDRDSRRDADGKSDSLTDMSLKPGELRSDATDTLRKRGEGMGPTMDPGQRERRGTSDGLFEFGSLAPKSGSFLKDSTREGTATADRLESLRRVLGTSAPSILGTSGMKAGAADGLGGAGVLGTMGATPGVNRNLSQSLDSRSGANALVPTAEGPGSGERLTSIPNRPLGLDINTGREGFSSRSDRLQVAPVAPTPMEMFRKKHDSRIPSREF
jgi:hypothetical protein